MRSVYTLYYSNKWFTQIIAGVDPVYIYPLGRSAPDAFLSGKACHVQTHGLVPGWG